MPLPHDLKIGDKRQTRDGDTATLVAYLSKGKNDYRLLWTLRDERVLTTSEQGLYCTGYEHRADIPSLTVNKTSPQVGMTVRNLTPENRVGVIVALIPNLRVRYEACEAGQDWTDNAEVKWPWEDEWQLVSHD